LPWEHSQYHNEGKQTLLIEDITSWRQETKILQTS
jgi:hypothetical protein